MKTEYMLYVYGYKMMFLLNLNHDEDAFIRMKNDSYYKYKNLYQNYIRSEKIKKILNHSDYMKLYKNKNYIRKEKISNILNDLD